MAKWYDYIPAVAAGGAGTGILQKMFPQVKDFLLGTDPEMKPYNDKSLNFLQSMFDSNGGLGSNPLYQGGANFLQQLFGGGPNAFEAFERPYKEQFEQEVIPGILEQGVGAGTGAGASSSSGLNQALAQAGRGLTSQLAQLRGGLQMQGLPQALQYAQQPLENQFNAARLTPGQYYEKPGNEGLIAQILPLIIKGMQASGGGGL